MVTLVKAKSIVIF